MTMHTVDRPIAEKTRSEIEARLKGMGDYVKMSYLQRALKSGLDFDSRKFVLLKLAEIYDYRKMFLESAKMLKSAAEINTTFKDKIRDYLKAVDMFIRGGDFVEADRLFAQALALGNDSEKMQMKMQRKNSYLSQARFFLSNDKRNNARLIFEKTLTLELDMHEKKDVQKQLLELYNKLGLVREFYKLQDSMQK